MKYKMFLKNFEELDSNILYFLGIILFDYDKIAQFYQKKGSFFEV